MPATYHNFESQASFDFWALEIYSNHMNTGQFGFPVSELSDHSNTLCTISVKISSTELDNNVRNLNVWTYFKH